MIGYIKYSILVLFIIAFISEINAQGFVHSEGKNIVDGNGDNLILRGIGTGNWMLVEGYMMKTEGVAGTQHEFRQKLEELIGTSKTDEFFTAWLNNHFTKADVDSMKAWGFNSVRVAMHYKWFTLPIEEEPVKGKNTWVLKGFKLIDNLLDWCAQNEMYLILDLHGAPGGQGKNADISDYDPSKPSLWESQENKDKTVALWRQLAARYSNSKWIAGYDLINETNWDFPEGNNSQLRQLFEDITTAIREVDQNHILFIEGNSFANDHSGLTPPWDDNLVYSFHKYWSGTSQTDLDWILRLRDEQNVPLWMGESGENSNTWFTDFITSLEKNNIGWSWWPVKKNSINNVLNVPINKEYEELIQYWKNEITTAPSADKTFRAVMQWADNHKIKNCTVQHDVIDAMIRQPHTDEVIPYKKNKLNKPIFFSDFDLGKNGFAYFDNDVAYYGGQWTAWNTGWGVRNDGVDIEKCFDTQDTTNGFNVGWVESGEWTQFTLQSDSTALYDLNIRHAASGSGSTFHIEINDADVTGELSLNNTGGWQKWKTTNFENILIPAGKIRIKWVNNTGGSNLSYFSFANPQSARNIDFKALAARTSTDGKQLFVSCNKEITSAETEINLNDFVLSINGNQTSIDSIKKYNESSNELLIFCSNPFFSDQVLTLSYNGVSVKSHTQNLQHFSNLPVQNNLPVVHPIPGLIEAESFAVNNGLSLEDCSDAGGGKNTSYSAAGEYLDYRVHVAKTGIYNLNYRVATQHSDAKVEFLVGDGVHFTPVDTFRFAATGGWQSWQTQLSQNIRLETGYYFVRILIQQGEHNLNWFSLDLVTATSAISRNMELSVFPNPANAIINIQTHNFGGERLNIQLLSQQGVVLKNFNINSHGVFKIDIQEIPAGLYFIKVEGSKKTAIKRFIKQ